jgi:hypothetical protein
MKCVICGYNYGIEESKGSCARCPFSIGCLMIRCPNCGFEEPANSTILDTLNHWRTRK